VCSCGDWGLGARGWGELSTRNWRIADPHQHPAVFIDGETLSIDQLGLEIFYRFILQIELTLERPVGHLLVALQPSAYLADQF
jgi:hypothetical protein